MSLFLSPFKFLFCFTVSFLILCFPVKNDRYVFNHLEEFARPLTSKVYFFIDQQTKKGIEKGKKIFTNSAPVIKDKIRSSLSSSKKEKRKEEDFENYTVEEREAIKKFLSNEY